MTMSQLGRFVNVIELSLILAIIGGLNFQRPEVGNFIDGASALLSPRARVCFNSLAATFQSECVYCDSKLYASTMNACTGSPILANNVTQTQAFCIATACLQVPVHEPLDNSSETTTTTSHQLVVSSEPLEPDLYMASYLLDNHDSVMRWKDSDWLARVLSEKISRYTNKSDDTETEPAQVKLANTNEPTGGQRSCSLEPVSSTQRTTQVVALVEPSSTPRTPTTLVAKSQLEYPDFSRMYEQIEKHYMGLNKKPATSGGWLMVSSSSEQRHKGLLQALTSNLSAKRASLGRWWYSLMTSTMKARGRQPMQTGKNPVVLGRRRRSLIKPLSFNLNKSKQKGQLNGTLSAQVNKLVNGTTSGNVNFVLNNPKAAYLLSNPISRVFAQNSPNKSFQWQFGGRNRAGGSAPASAASSRPTTGQSSGSQPARAAQPIVSGSPVGAPVSGQEPGEHSQAPTLTSYVVPAARTHPSG